MQEFTTATFKQGSTLQGVYAIIGCDGTGKSTLTRDLLTHLRQTGPAQRRYLGLVSGEMANKIKRPIPGTGRVDSTNRHKDRKNVDNKGRRKTISKNNEYV